jgi:hypothetical protein
LQWGRTAWVLPISYQAGESIWLYDFYGIWSFSSKLGMGSCIEQVAALDSAFACWDMVQVGQWEEAEALLMMQEAGIVRHRRQSMAAETTRPSSPIMRAVGRPLQPLRA